MNLFQIVGMTGQGLNYAVRGATRDNAAGPLVLIALGQAIVGIGLFLFHLPTFSPLFLPLALQLAGEAGTHYPEHLWVLPEMLRVTDVFFMVLPGSLAVAVATLRYAGLGGGWSRAFAHAPTLLGFALLGPGLGFAIVSAFNLIPPEITIASFVIRIGFQGLELGIVALILTLTAYGPAFTIVHRRRFGSALRGSLHLNRHLFLPTFLVVALPLATLFPLNFFLREMNLSQSGLIPGMVGALLVVHLLLQLGTWILSVGAVTWLFLRATGMRT